MAVITLPPVYSSSMQLALTRGDSTLEFFDGSEAIIASQIALWTITMRLRPMRGENHGRAWFAALTQLSRLENTCKIPANGLVRGTSYTGANPTVNGGSQLGNSLNVQGAAGSTLIAAVGDPIEVNGEYKILTQDAVTTGGGAATLHFEPALRQSPSGGSTVNVKTPMITARLLSPVANLDALLSGHYDMTLTMIESYRP